MTCVFEDFEIFNYFDLFDYFMLLPDGGKFFQIIAIQDNQYCRTIDFDIKFLFKQVTK